MPQGKHTIRLWLFFVLSVCIMPVWGQAQEEGMQEKILEVFLPYRQGPPQVEGITPGMKIDQSNWQVAEKVLPPEILKVLAAGEFTMPVQETTNAPVREEYITASVEGAGKAELGEGWKLKNYTAGLPFPLLDPADPEAGTKAAWNHRYRDQGDTYQMWPILHVLNRSGGVQRSIEFYYAVLHGMHRTQVEDNIPQWEKEGRFYGEYSEMLSPLDVAGAISLRYRFDKDTTPAREWAYDPRTRRARQTVYNPLQSPVGQTYLLWKS
jgi:hypothetical protein